MPAQKYKISLMAVYNYDNTIFDDFVLPEGADKEAIVNNILMETIDRDVLYNDPNYLKWAIGVWSKKNLDEWTLIKSALDETYNPAENYDRIEDTTETRDLANTDNETRNLAHDTTETRDLTAGNTETNKVSAFNSNTFENASQTTDTGTNTGTIRDAGTDTGTVGHAGTDTGTIRRAGRIHGNIGTVSSTKLVEEFISFRAKACFNQIITDAFISNFILLCY